MAMVGEIEHITSYRYAKPVSFGTHRAMFLPRRGATQSGHPVRFINSAHVVVAPCSRAVTL